MCHLGHTMTQCSLPSPIYSIFLKRELISLQAHALAAGAPCYVNTVDKFLDLYKFLSEPDKNLLCELYQHDLVLIGFTECDPNPYVGDVHIMTFTSFIDNQLKWNNCMKFIEKVEKTKGIKLRGEPTHPK